MRIGIVRVAPRASERIRDPTKGNTKKFIDSYFLYRSLGKTFLIDDLRKSNIFGKFAIFARFWRLFFFDPKGLVQQTGYTRKSWFAMLRAKGLLRLILFYVLFVVFVYGPLIYSLTNNEPAKIDAGFLAEMFPSRNFGATGGSTDFIVNPTVPQSVVLGDIANVSLSIRSRHTSNADALEVKAVRDFRLRATVRGTAFEVSPSRDNLRNVPTFESNSCNWSWMLIPKQVGSQLLVLTVDELKIDRSGREHDLGQLTFEVIPILVKKPIFAWDNAQTFIAIAGTLIALAGFVFRKPPSASNGRIVRAPSDQSKWPR